MVLAIRNDLLFYKATRDAPQVHAVTGQAPLEV